MLGSGKAEATYRDVMDKVKAKVTGTYRRQHPQLEGANLDNYLLSDRSSLSDPFVPASPKGDGITLEAGQVHGMTVGSVFDVYPPGTKSFDDPSQATAQAELVTVGPYQSEAKRVGASRSSRLRGLSSGGTTSRTAGSACISPAQAPRTSSAGSARRSPAGTGPTRATQGRRPSLRPSR